MCATHFIFQTKMQLDINRKYQHELNENRFFTTFKTILFNSNKKAFVFLTCILV